MTDIHLNAESIHFSYDKKVSVLLDIGFAVRRNEVVAFVGPNGGGKTTLLRLLAGLLKSDMGSLYYNGKCARLSESARLVGYVPQYARFDKQFPMTVYDIVLSGFIKPFGFYSKEERRSTEKALEQIGLTAMRDFPINELSGGQVQRTLIARALVSPKEFLLLDEPTANIDQESSRRLKELISDLKQTLTVLLVTHDTDFIYNSVDRVFHVNQKLKELTLGSYFAQYSSLMDRSLKINHRLKLQESLLCKKAV